MDRERIEADIFESKKKARSNLMTRMTIHCERLLTVLVNQDAALAEAEAENARLRDIGDRLIEAGVETWHVWSAPLHPPLVTWLGLTEDEYASWVERRGLFASRPGEGAA